MIQIRRAQYFDESRIKELLYEEHINLEAFHFGYEAFTLCQNGNNILGCGCGIIKDAAVFINLVTVNKQFRNQKIGSSIVKAIINIADLGGAKYAYMKCQFKEFAEYLKFDLLQYEESTQIIFDIFNKMYNCNTLNNVYAVKLKDYFKPCCC